MKNRKILINRLQKGAFWVRLHKSISSGKEPVKGFSRVQCDDSLISVKENGYCFCTASTKPSRIISIM